MQQFSARLYNYIISFGWLAYLCKYTAHDIIWCSWHCTCTVPGVANNNSLSHIHTRINLGGMHSVSYLHRLLQLKYPNLQAHVSLSRAQELLERHCYTALDYTGELREWASGLHDNDYRVIQLPFNQVSLLYSTIEGQLCVTDHVCILYNSERLQNVPQCMTYRCWIVAIKPRKKLQNTLQNAALI